MDTLILAEILPKMDIRGVWCFASIIFFIIALIPFSKGMLAGFTTNCIFFIIAVFAYTDSYSGGGGGEICLYPNKSYITNKNQTKIIERHKYSINDPYCIFSIRGNGIDSYAVFIPAEEMYQEDGYLKMKTTKKVPTENDYYLYDETIDPINASIEVGGWGCPTWLYHPASPLYIFGAFAFLPLVGGVLVANKISG